MRFLIGSGIVFLGLLIYAMITDPDLTIDLHEGMLCTKAHNESRTQLIGKLIFSRRELVCDRWELQR